MKKATLFLVLISFLACRSYELHDPIYESNRDTQAVEDEEDDGRGCQVDYPRKEMIAGKWISTAGDENIIINFSFGNMKELVIDKKTGKAISEIFYGEYSLVRYIFEDGRVQDCLKINYFDSFLSNYVYFDLKDGSLILYDWFAPKVVLSKVEY